MAEVQGIPLSELEVDDLLKLHDAFEDDVEEVWDFDRSVEQRDVAGGTSRRAILVQVEQLRTWLAV